MFLSIITPTYNRAYILPKCYESLVNQTIKDFEWIVVDDGSTDDTENLINSFIKENKIDIKYVKKENGGKPSAHNLGAEYAAGEMFLCLDSDDILTEDAVEVAKNFWQNSHTDGITGILAKRGSIKNKEQICSSWNENLKSSTMYNLFNELGFSGDTALFFKTEILKQEKFPSFIGEKFIPETALYSDIDKHGKMLLLDKVLYLTEYLPDGLTYNYHKLLKNNPYGTAYSYYKQLCIAKSLKQKLRLAMLFNIYSTLFNGTNKIILKERMFWVFVTKIPAKVYSKKFLNRFK